tara:strand:+ start:217 stop:492 length:276 start_codon:yes stop_codon:yes gene_type:complete
MEIKNTFNYFINHKLIGTDLAIPYFYFIGKDEIDEDLDYQLLHDPKTISDNLYESFFVNNSINNSDNDSLKIKKTKKNFQNKSKYTRKKRK